MIVAVVAGVLAVATAVVAFALAPPVAATLQAGIAAGAEERERLERELDTLARLFADQAEQLADLQHVPPVELAPADAVTDPDELAEEVDRRPVGAAPGAVPRRCVLQQVVAAARRKVTPLSVVGSGSSTGSGPRAAPRSTTAQRARRRRVAHAARDRRGVPARRRRSRSRCSVDTAEPGALHRRPNGSASRCVEARSRDALTVSAGIACYPSHALDAAELVHAPGEALGIAKAGGWDRVATAAPPDSI